MSVTPLRHELVDLLAGHDVRAEVRDDAVHVVEGDRWANLWMSRSPTGRFIVDGSQSGQPWPPSPPLARRKGGEHALDVDGGVAHACSGRGCGGLDSNALGRRWSVWNKERPRSGRRKNSSDLVHSRSQDRSEAGERRAEARGVEGKGVAAHARRGGLPEPERAGARRGGVDGGGEHRAGEAAPRLSACERVTGSKCPPRGGYSPCPSCAVTMLPLVPTSSGGGATPLVLFSGSTRTIGISAHDPVGRPLRWRLADESPSETFRRRTAIRQPNSPVGVPRLPARDGIDELGREGLRERARAVVQPGPPDGAPSLSAVHLDRQHDVAAVAGRVYEIVKHDLMDLRRIVS